ncbi:MAG: glycosyltransferase family 4 protein [Pseudomonadota bacterium]
MSQALYRVLQVLPAFDTGGVEQGTFDIAHALVRNNHHAFITSEGGSMVRDLPQSNCNHIFMGLNTKNPVKIFKNSLSLKKLIQDECIDLVHARSRAPAWSAYIACKQTQTPLVTTFHSTYGHQNRFEVWYNSVMTRADRIIAISEFIDQHIRRIYSPYIQGQERQIDIVHRCVDLEKFTCNIANAKQAQQLKEMWGVPNDHRVIVLPGRVVRRKGHKILLKALENLKNGKWTCLFVGKTNPDSKYVKELRQQIKELSWEQKIKFVGNCTDMPAVNLLADVVVVSSTVPEAFGRTMAEAGAMGTPVIASNIGAAPEIIEHSKTGWLISPDDTESLTKQLEIVFSMSNQQRESLAQTARNRIHSLFSKDEMCRKTLEIYAQVIEGARKSTN